MSHHHSRSFLTFGSSRKRKEREAVYPFSAQPSLKADDESAHSSNQLLAGYMAYEYLTKGTFFGQKFGPGRAEAVPLARKKEHESYDEVASILKTDGAHIPGVVNPTQLARLIQM
ncbi:uncharacterized protein [Euphorbia lathyris]|uniref:uncharacterized protein n=1 Tax=Euphorbia lathyris TaxID=212925 RepID=UPI003313D19B